MLVIKRERLVVTEAEFAAQFDQYAAAVEAHKRTVGVPAPLPEHEVFRDILARGGEYTIEDEEGVSVDPKAGKSRAMAMVELIVSDPDAINELKSRLGL